MRPRHELRLGDPQPAGYVAPRRVAAPLASCNVLDLAERLGGRMSELVRAGAVHSFAQQIPILVWQGKVIDGRKRLAACQALGIAPVTTVLPDDAPAPQLASDLNLIRTHYSAAQRAVYAAKIANLSVGQRTEEQAGNGYHDTHSRQVSSGQAARAFAVTQQSVKHAKRVMRTAAPEVVAAVERGELSLRAATRIAQGTPTADQAERPQANQTELTESGGTPPPFFTRTRMLS